MTEPFQNIPKRYRGPWCDQENAKTTREDESSETGFKLGEDQLRRDWANALLKGDLRSAHKLWGKWQGYSGQDPWEEEGWRNFWEARQAAGERREETADERDVNDAVYRTYISYRPGLRED